MSRRDFHHHAVVHALEADGWTITHDPFPLRYGGQDLYVDLGAELAIAAEKDGRRIAVEVKSFVGPSDVSEFETALGQSVLYADVLSEVEPDRELYVAVPERTFQGIFRSPLGQLILKRHALKLIVFSEEEARIVQWVP